MDNLSCFLLFMIVLFGLRSVAANQIHRNAKPHARNPYKPNSGNDLRGGSKP